MHRQSEIRAGNHRKQACVYKTVARQPCYISRMRVSVVAALVSLMRASGASYFLHWLHYISGAATLCLSMKALNSTDQTVAQSQLGADNCPVGAAPTCRRIWLLICTGRIVCMLHVAAGRSPVPPPHHQVFEANQLADHLLRRQSLPFTCCTPRVRTPPHTSCLLYTSPSPRDRQKSRMPSSA